MSRRTRPSSIFDQSITSFLCTDASREIFDDGGKQLDRIELKYPDYRPPSAGAQTLTNAQCLKEARDFFAYADVEGYRGSPHKL